MIGENGPIPLTPDQGIVEGGAYNLRHPNEATFDIARARQQPQGGLADFAALHRIGRLACCKGVHGCVEGRTVVCDLT